ncbi:hypothetical protein VD0003_g10243, partial [Verticillium dahliae]
MDSQEKKPTPANVDTDSTQASSTDVADARVKANDEPSQATDDDQYPSGLKMVLLSSAALIVIFLIALDQA